MTPALHPNMKTPYRRGGNVTIETYTLKRALRPWAGFFLGWLLLGCQATASRPAHATNTVLIDRSVDRCGSGAYSCGNGFCCPETSECCDGTNCPAGTCEYDGEWHLAIEVTAGQP